MFLSYLYNIGVNKLLDKKKNSERFREPLNENSRSGRENDRKHSDDLRQRWTFLILLNSLRILKNDGRRSYAVKKFFMTFIESSFAHNVIPQSYQGYFSQLSRTSILHLRAVRYQLTSNRAKSQKATWLPLKYFPLPFSTGQDCSAPHR